MVHAIVESPRCSKFITKVHHSHSSKVSTMEHKHAGEISKLTLLRAAATESGESEKSD